MIFVNDVLRKRQMTEYSCTAAWIIVIILMFAMAVLVSTFICDCFKKTFTENDPQMRLVSRQRDFP